MHATAPLSRNRSRFIAARVVRTHACPASGGLEQKLPGAQLVYSKVLRKPRAPLPTFPTGVYATGINSVSQGSKGFPAKYSLQLSECMLGFLGFSLHFITFFCSRVLKKETTHVHTYFTKHTKHFNFSFSFFFGIWLLAFSLPQQNLCEELISRTHLLADLVGAEENDAGDSGHDPWHP